MGNCSVLEGFDMADKQGGDAPAADYFGCTFSVEDEDHTLANSLRFFLNKK